MPLAFKCRGCGLIQPQRWEFQCPGCSGYFNIVQTNADIEGAQIAPAIDGEVISLNDAIIHAVDIPRIETEIKGIDHVLGGGLATNGLYLLCGDPGVGKTTVVIQTLQALARLRYDVLFITGEQTVNDVALRAKNYGKFSSRMLALRETDLDRILDIIIERKPAVVAIDSAQTLSVDSDDGFHLDIGSSTSIKTAARILMKFAKDENICIILIGHVTKDGGISGPRALEHLADCSLYFAGNPANSIRYLKCENKNRFGSTPKHARFNMTDKGLIEFPEEEEEEEFNNDKDISAVATQTAPALTSIPLDLSMETTVDKIDKHFPNPNLSSYWMGPDGTTAASVLAVKCDVEECRGSVDHACTSANGTRESGFHEARIAKSKLKKPEETVLFEAEEEDLEPDPFTPGPLKGKPRLVKR